jgi:hypothetical protein
MATKEELGLLLVRKEELTGEIAASRKRLVELSHQVQEFADALRRHTDLVVYSGNSGEFSTGGVMRIARSGGNRSSKQFPASTNTLDVNRIGERIVNHQRLLREEEALDFRIAELRSMLYEPKIVDDLDAPLSFHYVEPRITESAA